MVCCDVLCYGMAWHGMVYVMVWYGLVWHGMVQYGTVYFMVWYGIVWYSMVWYILWYGMLWYDMVWYVMYGMIYVMVRYMVSHGIDINQPFCLPDQTLVLQCRHNVLLRSKNEQTQESFENQEAIKTTQQPLLLNYKKN